MKGALIGLLVILSGCGMCANDIVQEIVSPDGKYVATAFIRNCGATTDYSPQVYLRKTGKRLADKGNVFIGDHSDFIRIEWLSATELLVSSNCSIVTHEKKFKGVTVIFKAADYPKKTATKLPRH
jgi:hypothetical protein